jgi:TRAP-type C4-dicarboxylate transport system permease large subunit
VKAGSLGAGLAAWAGALLASLCCLLPLAIIVVGLGGGAFMAVTMRYTGILLPAGVLGVTLGFVLYVRERRRCTRLACRMAGSRMTLALLIAAALVVASAIALDRFPEMTSDLLARLADGPGQDQGAGHDMKGMDTKEERR